MIVDGTALAHDIEEETAARIRALGRTVRLSIFTCQPNLATRRFLEIKRAQAKKIGVVISVEECAPESDTGEIVKRVVEAISTSDGIIIQLPFPYRIDLTLVLTALPAGHDVDGIGSEAEVLFLCGMPLILPPVVGAIAAILKQYEWGVENKNVVVVGEGKLVGAPAAIWFKQQGAAVSTINRETPHIEHHTQEADILVLGAGVPGLVKPDMVREGAAIFDAGSSEDTGKLVGDADPACAEKASLFTPVPGGIGPITVALIFQNLLTLLKSRKKESA